MAKKIIFLVILFQAAFVIINNFLPDEKAWEPTAKKALLPVRYAGLLAREPESKIQIPIRSLRKKQIADTWGAPRSGERQHQGQDLFAPRGTPIYSATDGFVYRIGENSLGGKTVSIIGAGGRVYYYAHLDDYAQNLNVGDVVTTESVLGYVGTTGNAKGTPPHLHFGVYTTGGAINPMPLFD